MGRSINNVFPPVPLYDMLLEKVEEKRRDSDYEIVKIDDEPIDWISNCKPRGCSLIVGAHTVTDVTNRVKYTQEFPVSVGEVAHEYLRFICGDGYKRKLSIWGVSNPPMYFCGARRGPMSYVDIRSCYFSLYSAASMDCFYDGHLFSQGKIRFARADELSYHKLTRNTVFGLIQKKGRVRFKDGEYKRTNELGPFFSGDLSAYVMDSIQAIAQESVQKFGVYAWLTDAAILPSRQAEGFRDFLFTEWGLDSREESRGPGYLYTNTRYRVGDMVGGSALAGLTGQASNNFCPVNIDLLKGVRRGICEVV